VKTAVVCCILMLSGVISAGGVPWSHFNLIDAPSAHMLRHTEIAVGGSFVPFSVEDSTGSSSTQFAFGTYLEVGILDRAQVGATFISSGGISGTARFLLLRETIRSPGISIGCENIIGEENYEGYEMNDSLQLLPQHPCLREHRLRNRPFPPERRRRGRLQQPAAGAFRQHHAPPVTGFGDNHRVGWP